MEIAEILGLELSVLYDNYPEARDKDAREFVLAMSHEERRRFRILLVREAGERFQSAATVLYASLYELYRLIFDNESNDERARAEYLLAIDEALPEPLVTRFVNNGHAEPGFYALLGMFAGIRVGLVDLSDALGVLATPTVRGGAMAYTAQFAALRIGEIVQIAQNESPEQLPPQVVAAAQHVLSFQERAREREITRQQFESAVITTVKMVGGAKSFTHFPWDAVRAKVTDVSQPVVIRDINGEPILVDGGEVMCGGYREYTLRVPVYITGREIPVLGLEVVTKYIQSIIDWNNGRKK